MSAARAIGLVVERNGTLYHAGDAPKGFKSASDSTAPRGNQEPDASTKTQQQEQQQQNAAPQIERLDEASETAMTEIVSKVPESEARAFSREMIENGSLSHEGVAKVAQRLGITEEQAGQKAQALHQAYYDQASRSVGPHADAVWDYARKAAPQALRDAVNEQVTNGTTNGYKALNAKFMASLDTMHPDLLLQSDALKPMNVRREGDGQITLEVRPGVRTSWRNAVQNGLIPMPTFRSNPFVKG